jgi:DNA-binding SARP family transcriptional activator
MRSYRVTEHKVEFRILGPVEAVAADRPVILKGSMTLTLMAGLLSSAGQAISRERLVDWLWSTDPPEHPRAALHNAVARLRRLLGADSIETLSWGYRLPVDASCLDLLRFDQLTAHACRLAGHGIAAGAVDALGEAVALWRTPLLGNVGSPTLRRAVVPRLTDRYLAAVEERAELCLRIGRHDGLAEGLAEVARDHPFREAVVGQLMVALVVAGRQADALAAYDTLCRSLKEELGIDPLPALSHLRARILRGESTLDTAFPALRAKPARV